MPSYNTITGAGEPPPPDDGSYEIINIIQQAEPELEAPDPRDLWDPFSADAGAPQDGGYGGGGGPDAGAPQDASPPAHPNDPEVDAEQARMEAERAAAEKAAQDAYAAQRAAEASHLRDQAKDGILLPEKMPPNFDLTDAMRRAREHSNDPLWFYNQVKTGGEWDWKKNDPDLQDFGNMFFGAVGRAFGLSEETLQRGAGWYQEHMSDTGNPNWGSFTDNNSGPYGDDPVDQFWIEQGSKIFEANANGPGVN